MKFANIQKRILLSLTFSIIILNLFSEVSLRMKSKTKQLKKAEFNRKTTPDDWGRNNIFYLDRQNVECNPTEALQGFKLYRPTSNQLAYNYACIQNSLVKSDTYYNDKTPLNIVGGNHSKSAHYLDRHRLQCKDGYALQRFQLKRDGNNIYYSYKCISVNCGEKKNFETPRTSDGGYETIYLDRQDVRVRTNEVITGFKLFSKEGHFYYEVNYCVLTAPVAPIPEKQTDPKPVNPTPTLSAKEKRQNFCKNNCVFNPNGQKKKCKLTSGEFICRRCTTKQTVTDLDIKKGCETFCDSKGNDDLTCAFYGFMNNLQKTFDANILKKLDISLEGQ